MVVRTNARFERKPIKFTEMLHSERRIYTHRRQQHRINEVRIRLVNIKMYERDHIMYVAGLRGEGGAQRALLHRAFCRSRLYYLYTHSVPCSVRAAAAAAREYIARLTS